jgi:hypothetical protein
MHTHPHPFGPPPPQHACTPWHGIRVGLDRATRKWPRGRAAEENVIDAFVETLVKCAECQARIALLFVFIISKSVSVAMRACIHSRFLTKIYTHKFTPDQAEKKRRKHCTQQLSLHSASVLTDCRGEVRDNAGSTRQSGLCEHHRAAPGWRGSCPLIKGGKARMPT